MTTERCLDEISDITPDNARQIFNEYFGRNWATVGRNWATEGTEREFAHMVTRSIESRKMYPEIFDEVRLTFYNKPQE